MPCEWELYPFDTTPTMKAKRWLGTLGVDHRAPDIVQQLLRREFRRSCGPCTACCTSLEVYELSKPCHEKCPHLLTTGCGCYAERPESCKGYYCQWKMGFFSDQARPDLSGVIVTFRADVTPPTLIIFRDEAKVLFEYTVHLANVLSHIMAPTHPKRGLVEICSPNRRAAVVGTPELFTQFFGPAMQTARVL